MISSFSNPRVKEILRLRKSSERRRTGKFLIDGYREIQTAIEHGIQIEALYYSGLSPGLPISETNTMEVSANVIERISYGQQNDMPVAVASTPDFDSSHLPGLDSRSLVLVLDHTEKPGNLGACLRTASACGVAAVLLVDPICEVLNPNAIRASRGAVFTVPIAVLSQNELRGVCTRHELNLICSQVDASDSLWNCDFNRGCAVVFGNETSGLSHSWRALADGSFTIPMYGSPDSLNLSISTAVTLYEAVRQRNASN